MAGTFTGGSQETKPGPQSCVGGAGTSAPGCHPQIAHVAKGVVLPTTESNGWTSPSPSGLPKLAMGGQGDRPMPCRAQGLPIPPKGLGELVAPMQRGRPYPFGYEHPLVAVVAMVWILACPLPAQASQPPIIPWDCVTDSDCLPGFSCRRGGCQDEMGPFNGEPVRLLVLPTVDRTEAAVGTSWLRARFTDLLSLLLGSAGPFEPLDARSDVVLSPAVLFEAIAQRAAYIVIPELKKIDQGKATFEVRFHDAEWDEPTPELATTMDVDLRTLVLPAQQWINGLIQGFTGLPGILGTRIAVVRKLGPGVKELYMLTYGLPEITPLTQNGSLNLLPSWAPDGRIAFTSHVRKMPYVYVLGQEKPFSAQDGLNSGVDWSKDGTKAAMTLNRDESAEIYEIDPKTGEPVRRLTNSPAIDTAPSFSPDGSRIVFVSNRTGGPQLFIMNSDGSDVRQLTTSGSYNCSPDWHPFGPWVVYASQTASGFDIRVINTETGFDRRLAGGSGRCEDPDWSPDGRLVVFTWQTRREGQDVYAMSANGRSVQRLTFDGGPYSAPVWEPRPPGTK